MGDPLFPARHTFSSSGPGAVPSSAMAFAAFTAHMSRDAGNRQSPRSIFENPLWFIPIALAVSNWQTPMCFLK
jgi:hypothetical protein